MDQVYIMESIKGFEEQEKKETFTDEIMDIFRANVADQMKYGPEKMDRAKPIVEQVQQTEVAQES